MVFDNQNSAIVLPFVSYLKFLKVTNGLQT
jgi:hypothetical protein